MTIKEQKLIGRIILQKLLLNFLIGPIIISSFLYIPAKTKHEQYLNCVRHFWQLRQGVCRDHDLPMSLLFSREIKLHKQQFINFFFPHFFLFAFHIELLTFQCLHYTLQINYSHCQNTEIERNNTQTHTLSVTK